MSVATQTVLDTIHTPEAAMSESSSEQNKAEKKR